jgi:hypothetical protein
MTVPAQAVFPVFVGSGRSGTTLLRTIFDAHPHLAVAHEPQFMGTVARNRSQLEANGFHLDEFVSTINANANYRRLELDSDAVRHALDEAEPASVADAVRVVLGEYARREDKPLYADKTPGYVIQIPELSKMFPEIRFVHLIRDGRDVALSYLERPWGPSTIGESAMYWRSRVGRGRRAGRAIGPERYLEVRYEELVANTEPEVARICSFLSLPFAPEMLQYHESAKSLIAGSHQPEAFSALLLPPTSGLRDWTTQMNEDDVALFEAIAGDLLEDLDYPRRSRTFSLATRARVLRAEAAWSARRAREAAKTRLRRSKRAR